MILKIRKDERLLAAAAFTAFALLNALLIYCHFERFTRATHVGFWSLFYNHLNVSGYDVFSLIAISCMRVHYNMLRHPLFIAVLLPLYWINQQFMGAAEFNMAMFLMAAVLIACDVYGFIFMHRIMREIVGLGRADALLLTTMLYSFAHVMLAAIVPDHFAISLALLLGTLYVTGKHLQEGKPLRWWEQALMFFLTAGITLTNGVKTFIAALAVNGKKVLAWRQLAAFIVPTLVLGALVLWQQKAIIEPQEQNIKKIEKAAEKKDPHMADRIKTHDAWVKKQNGEAIAKSVPLLEWSDMTTSRLRSATDNLFGESLQLHRDHLLEDVQQTRPVFVGYRWAASYTVEAVVALLFIAGAWAARRNRFFQVALAWFMFDMLMHMGFGFGLNEVYIMAAHWAFVIPIAAAYLLKSTRGKARKAVRTVVAGATAWMLAYNIVILFGYFTTT